MNFLFLRPFGRALAGFCCALGVCSLGLQSPANGASITVNGATTYQVIDGFGVNVNHWNIDEVRPVFDALVDQGGMSLFRVIYDTSDWEASNDNGDPNVMNWNYYNSVYGSASFQPLWDDIAYLNQKGITNGVMLNFMGGGPSWLVTSTPSGDFLTPGYEAEWAEMVGSLLYYARNNRHLQFGLVGPNNEPDNTSDSAIARILVTPGQYVTTLHLLAQFLDANGMSDVSLVAPDLAYTSTNWLGTMMNDPVIMSKIAHFGMHSYFDGGVGATGVYDFIRQSPYSDRDFWMTEFNVWCNSCEHCGGGDSSWGFARGTASYLLNYLANGASAGLVWTGYDTNFRYLSCWSTWGLFAVADPNASFKTFTPRKGFYTLSQFSKFIRPGARRIGLSGSTSTLNVLAFYHPTSGQVTLTGINTDSSSTFLTGTLASLPGVTSFDLYYTSATDNLTLAATIPVANGAFTALIPADCVFTLVSHPAASASTQVWVTPSSAVIQANGQQQFSAVAVDGLGVSLSPQPVFSWSVSGGGVIDSNGLFSASGQSGGPFVITADAGVATGSASVSVISSGQPVLPQQPDRTINQLSTLIVTNTANSALVSQFAYANRDALIADGWSFVGALPTGPRNTEITDPLIGALVSYDQSAHPGILRIPCDIGDLWTTYNNTRNSLFRALPANWLSAQLAVSFAPNLDYQQAHLGLYQDDDNYIQVGVAHNSYQGGELLAMDREVGGAFTSSAGPTSLATNFYFRLDRNPASGAISGSFSLTGSDWTALGTANQTFLNPRLAVWVGGLYNASYQPGMANCDLRWLTISLSNAVPKILTYSLVSPPTGASIDTNGIITWQPSNAQGPGVYPIVTVVTDNGLPPASATNGFLVTVNVTNPPVQVLVTPASAAVLPYGQQQFAAVAVNSPGTNQPAFSWSVSGGGVIDSNGLFSANGQFGGPFVVTANGIGTNGVASLSVISDGKPVLPPQLDLAVDELSTLIVTNTAIDANPAAPHIGTNTILFNYTNRSSLLADGWSFIGANGRNTETTTGAGVVDYDQSAHPGVLNIPCDQGDLYGTSYNNTRNTLFRSLPSDWQSVRLALTFAPLAVNYQQAHLGLYQDDDNYLQIGVANNAAAYHRLTMDFELAGYPATPAVASTSNTDLYFRLDRDPINSLITCYYSFDGAAWTALGSQNVPFANPRLMIWTGGSDAAHADQAVMGLDHLDVVAGIPTPTVVSYALINPPAGATIDTNGIITWQPAEAQGPGSNTLVTVVTDNGMVPASATNSFVVTVNEINTAPILPAQPDQVLMIPAVLTVTNTATDTDLPTNSLSYQLIAAPAGAAIDLSGIISWTPAPAQAPSTNLFTTVVTDSNPWAVNNPHLSATNSFSVTVLSAPAPAPFHVLSVAVTNRAVLITWESVPGQAYRLQYKTDWGQTNWQDLVPDVTANGSTASGTDTMGREPSRFYRVIIP